MGNLCAKSRKQKIQSSIINEVEINGTSLFLAFGNILKEKGSAIMSPFYKYPISEDPSYVLKLANYNLIQKECIIQKDKEVLTSVFTSSSGKLQINKIIHIRLPLYNENDKTFKHELIKSYMDLLAETEKILAQDLIMVQDLQQNNIPINLNAQAMFIACQKYLTHIKDINHSKLESITMILENENEAFSFNEQYEQFKMSQDPLNNHSEHIEDQILSQNQDIYNLIFQQQNDDKSLILEHKPFEGNSLIKSKVQKSQLKKYSNLKYNNNINDSVDLQKSSINDQLQQEIQDKSKDTKIIEELIGQQNQQSNNSQDIVKELIGQENLLSLKKNSEQKSLKIYSDHQQTNLLQDISMNTTQIIQQDKPYLISNYVNDPLNTEPQKQKSDYEKFLELKSKYMQESNDDLVLVIEQSKNDKELDNLQTNHPSQIQNLSIHQQSQMDIHYQQFQMLQKKIQESNSSLN